MKIIFATGIFPPDIGGPAIYVERLALELIKRDFEVKIITYYDGELKKSETLNPKSETNLKSQIPNTQIIRVSRKYPKGLRHFLYFLELLKLAIGADVIYAQNITSAGFPAFLVSKILRKKLVMKIVGNYAWEQSSMRGWFSGGISEFGKAKSWRIAFLKIIQEVLARKSDVIIVPCNYLKSAVNSWGVPENKIRVVYNAPEDFPYLAISKEEAQRKIGVEGKVILSISRLDPWKGFSCLIELMEDLLARESSDFKLLIIGEGDERANLGSEIEKLGLETSVKLLGRANHQDLPLFFKAADIFVLNSAQEGFSHVILEAMQQGVPVITTGEGGNPELIEHNVNGILVEYNNKDQLKKAIIELANDENLQRKFIENSNAKLKKFTWENLVEETLKALKS